MCRLCHCDCPPVGLDSGQTTFPRIFSLLKPIMHFGLPINVTFYQSTYFHCVFLSMYLPIKVTFYQCTYLSLCLSINVPTFHCVFLSRYLPFIVSFNQGTYLSLCLSIKVPTFQCVFLTMYPPLTVSTNYSFPIVLGSF